MSKIFISHSSADNIAAQAMADWLAENGWDEVFLDFDPERGIAASQRWEQALHGAALRCEAVIFLITTAWLGSPWCGKEYHLARSLNKPLFGLIADPALSIAAVQAKFPEYAATWQMVDLCAGTDAQIRKAHLPGQVIEGHVAWSQTGLRRLKIGLDKAGLDPKYFEWPPAHEPQRSPYPGLRALESADAGVFFGRDAALVEAGDTLRKLREAARPRLLVLLGASGAGKSSFLRAGLWPRLLRDDAHFLPLPPLRPGRAALSGDTGLEAALHLALPDVPGPRLRAAIAGGAAGLRPLLGELVARATPPGAAAPSLVIAVDQAEELFRAEGAGESAELMYLLRDLAGADDPATIILFVIRSDSYDKLEHAQALEGMPQKTLPLLPLPRSNYREVIEGPARRVTQHGGKLEIEPALTEALIHDAELGGGGDTLPLLAFVLEQLYRDHARSGALRLADYVASGRFEGAIDKAVARAFLRADSRPDIPQERAARETLLRRGLIPWLAGIDPETRSPRRAIARKDDIPPEALPLVTLLVEERLLIEDAHQEGSGPEAVNVATLEPAHEALLRQWGLLDGWLKEDQGHLATLEGVRRAARDWDANARGESWLTHQAGRLADARGLDTRPDLAAQLNARDRAYLSACAARETAAQAEREKAAANELALARAEAEKARARSRSARNLTGVAVAAALALAGLGLWALQQRNVARREAAAAVAAQAQTQAALKEATVTANALVFDIAQKFRGIKGVPVALIGTVLAMTLDMLDQLVTSGHAGSDMLNSQTIALDETATTLLLQGNSAAALADALKSRAIGVRLVHRQPGNYYYQRELSVSTQIVGQVRQARGDLSGALRAFRAVEAIREKLVALDPGNPDWQSDLSGARSRIGQVLQAQGDLAGALDNFRRSHAILKQLTDRHPKVVKWQNYLATADNEIGDVLGAQGDLNGALKSYEASLAIRQHLTQVDPGNANFQTDLALTEDRVGDVHRAQGNLDGAIKAYQVGLTIRRQLTASDPGNATWLSELALSDERVGDIRKAQGDLAGALRAYQASLETRKRLTAFDPGNNGWKNDLANSYWFVGLVFKKQNALPAALRAFQASLALRHQLVKIDPANFSWQGGLAAADEGIGDVLKAQGDFRGALKALQESLEIDQRVAATSPSDTRWQRNLELAYIHIGWLDLGMVPPDKAGALKALTLGRSIIAPLAAAHPDNVSYRKDLKWIDANLGKAR
ncbi:MAG: TIR domain-containing protein [Hyphomicrobiales bacterium]|nr:TIR domain-containing protein [Hyphomicrobiales bacterium]